MLFTIQADPYAWFVTLPLTIGLLWAQSLSQEHPIKCLWNDISAMEQEATKQMFIAYSQSEPQGQPSYRWLFWLTCSGLSLCSIASFHTFLATLTN